MVKYFSLVALLVGISFTAAAAEMNVSEKPNILLIVADDLGYADVGFNGGKTIATPNLDRFAATGINLTDFRACPMCSPTRAGLMTGRWPLRFGIMSSVIPPWSTNGLPQSEKTLPELLGTGGYENRGMIGKWHLGHAQRDFLPLAHGFTSFYGHYNGAIDYFDHTREHEVDWHHDDVTVQEPGYTTDLMGDDAVRFIREAPAGKPWFLYLPFNAPHEPLEAKPSDLAKYSQIASLKHRTYDAMVDSLDQAIGRVLAAVEASPGASNTLIIFMSDNGGVLPVGSSNYPWRGGKLGVYEGGTRVCAAIRWPAGGLTGGGHFDGRIGYIDLLPTLLAGAKIASPTNLDGINFLPALHGQPLPDRKWFSYIHQNQEFLASVHDGKWKLISRGDCFSTTPAVAPKFELYDLETDRGETDNVAVKHPEIVARLKIALHQFGTLEKAEGLEYDVGREGFKAPKDWVIKN